jgi:hypothetical protein
LITGLIGRHCTNRQRMYGTPHHVAKRIVNHPVAGHRPLAGKLPGNDRQPEVAATASGACMTGMQRTVVLYVDRERRKHLQAPSDFVDPVQGSTFL